MADVEMKPADDKAKKEETKNAEKNKPEPPTPVAEIKSNAALIEKAVANIEPRFMHRVLRSLAALRKRLNDKVLYDAVNEIFPKGAYAYPRVRECNNHLFVDSAAKASLLSWLPDASSEDQSMEIDSADVAPAKAPSAEPVPEVEVYLRLLVLHHLLTSKDTYGKALQLAQETVQKIHALNRRSMDPIAAKVWFAVMRAYELGGELSDARPLFLAAQRTASLRHDDETQAALINQLLRSYLNYSLYDQADKLVSKTKFPVSAANPQYTRYHYYLGRIRAVQLNYTDAHNNLLNAIRRAPPPKTAPGFYQAVHKLCVVVELLMGDIPERSTFRHPVLEKALRGYFDIVQAVRAGSLSQFQATLSRHAATFEADKTYTLIVRLRQNVIKTGIRRLSLSYSRISLRDICVKLHLDSEEDAEYIVGKAIRDGVIEGRIVHEKGWMECGGQKSGYGPEVSEMFARRIGYCLELHNESVKVSFCVTACFVCTAHWCVLGYAVSSQCASQGAGCCGSAREREKELAKEIQEGELDDEDAMGGDF
ncbi:hypothetical protein EWM64_g8646 [Hericium alpestre]|uniref:PCI domain-containing protein n=1 Tax=Hericium alpestre TaxID=135208 RepID=A0A4Y9ZL62_9AGAM|nr:hypothetical protein EWM64_g8646 [Hericium alpestre]